MTWMQTHSGNVIDFDAVMSGAPLPIDIHDIAVSLSHLCRFNGHTRRFYSVAEHSVYVAWDFCRISNRTLPHEILAALLHDAHEAYTGDIITPLKSIPEIRAAIDPLERKLDAAIFAALGVQLPDDELKALITRADRRVLMAEKRDLLVPCDRPWDAVYDTSELTIAGMKPTDARKFFLTEYEKWTR